MFLSRLAFPRGWDSGGQMRRRRYLCPCWPRLFFRQLCSFSLDSCRQPGHENRVSRGFRGGGGPGGVRHPVLPAQPQEKLLQTQRQVTLTFPFTFSTRKTSWKCLLVAFTNEGISGFVPRGHGTETGVLC